MNKLTQRQRAAIVRDPRHYEVIAAAYGLTTRSVCRIKRDPAAVKAKAGTPKGMPNVHTMKMVIAPDGRRFASGRAAAAFCHITPSGISYRIRHIAGWRLG